MGAATPLVEALRNFRNFIRIALLLAARLLARSLGSVDSKNRHYYIRAEPFEPMTARSDDKVGDKVDNPDDHEPATPETERQTRPPRPEADPMPSIEPEAKPLMDQSNVSVTEAAVVESRPERQPSSLVLRLTNENARLMRKLAESERETRASRQVMQFVLDFVEIAMASSRMDDKMASQLELLSALDKIEARIISCGFDSGGVVKRLNDMVDKYPR
jgi:hypothetical protein